MNLLRPSLTKAAQSLSSFRSNPATRANHLPMPPISFNLPTRCQQWFAQSKIGRKIGYGYALAIGVALLGTFVGDYLGNRYKEEASILSIHAQTELQINSNLKAIILQSLVHEQKLITLIDYPESFQKEYHELIEYTEEVQERWLELKKFAATAKQEEVKQYEMYDELFRKYDPIVTSYVQEVSKLKQKLNQYSIHSPEFSEQARTQLDNIFNKFVWEKLDQLTYDISDIMVLSQRELATAKQNEATANRLDTKISLFSTLLSIGIAASLAYLTIYAITLPIQATTKVAQRVSQESNFDLQAPVINNDEVGILTTSLNDLIKRFKTLLIEHKASAEQLRESQQLLQLVINTIPQTIYWKDRNSVFLGCNQKLAELAGLESPEAIIGKKDDEVLAKKEASLHDSQIMNTNSQEIGVLECVHNAYGQNMWTETNRVPLHDAEGNVIGILVTVQDITERKESELHLQQLNQELERHSLQLKDALTKLKKSQMELIQSEKMSSLGQLVAGIAHEINNPVNFIHGNITYANEYAHELLDLLNQYEKHYPHPPAEIETLRKDIDVEFLSEDFTKLLESMQIGTNRIRDIILSLRNFSRLDEAEVKNVDIHEGINSTLTILHNRIKAKPDTPEIQVIKEYGQLPLVECYPGQLNQVFMNIICNAIDAILETHIGKTYEEICANPGKIVIKTQLENDQSISIRITDNGPGMTKDVSAKLFDPFFTTKPVGQGTGLGLSISHQIITEKHGGKLYCNTAPGEGTEFVIEIPVGEFSVDV
ncbi:multi-sensor signal transduction multi-kinase [Richelia sinica FACHB-800]|uniref:histidine kinase n=1 Tax=Richelia sinica FACHB-800 TaxID=1357546 RepID=A0A975T544_9NOST|nr:ATP-binding protein [Richelia sinica]QXE22239.1 multi-sensor signal transduction multi-kinase [Richelia sinica FACHB-800]